MAFLAKLQKNFKVEAGSSNIFTNIAILSTKRPILHCNMSNNMENGGGRPLFTTRMGVIATTVGSAVGLGNIWRFPYEAGVHGGGAFMMLYIAFIIILGIPLITAEYALGRTTHRGVFGVFRALGAHRAWNALGYMGVLSAMLILSFYSVVAGWTLEYFFGAVGGAYTDVSREGLHTVFDEFTSGWRPLMWTVLFLVMNYLIISRGVARGIERISNVLMPLLFALIIIFCVNSLMLPGAAAGLTFLFKPDFSSLTAPVVIGAMGQAFFSLSLGLGCMLTYASYFNECTDIVKSATTTAALDTLIAVLAGVLIFPAVFSYGYSPEAGPKLVFEVLPAIFNQMTGGSIWAALFFFTLFIASLTSTISMCEIVVVFLCEEKKMKRRSACAVTIAVALVLGLLCAMSFGYFTGVELPLIGHPDFFSWFDYGTSNILLPLGGMLTSVFAGRVLDRKVFNRQITGSERPSAVSRLIGFSLRYICPALIAVIFIVNL